jgi:transposase InsO family protein
MAGVLRPAEDPAAVAPGTGSAKVDISSHDAARTPTHRTEQITIIRTPVRAPHANAIAERWIGTVRRECTDRILILGPRHLTAVLNTYITHYNTHRPHRALNQQPPSGPADPYPQPASQVRRTRLLGGLISEYQQVA